MASAYPIIPLSVPLCAGSRARPTGIVGPYVIVPSRLNEPQVQSALLCFCQPLTLSTSFEVLASLAVSHNLFAFLKSLALVDSLLHPRHLKRTQYVCFKNVFIVIVIFIGPVQYLQSQVHSCLLQTLIDPVFRFLCLYLLKLRKKKKKNWNIRTKPTAQHEYESLINIMKQNSWCCVWAPTNSFLLLYHEALPGVALCQLSGCFISLPLCKTIKTQMHYALQGGQSINHNWPGTHCSTINLCN